MMLDTMNDHGLTTHLMDIASDPALRQAVYDHMGEYCHQFRNRLNSLKLCLYLSKRQCCPTTPCDLSTLEEQYATLERSIELIQTLCRPMAVSLATLGLELLIEDRRPGWARQAAELDLELECLPPPVRAVAQFDPDRMGHALDVLVRWRLAQLGPGSSARLAWRVDRGSATVTWQEEAKAFAQATPPADPSHVWALPLITRIADAHQGEARIRPGDGWGLDLRWPCRADGSASGAAR